MKRHRPVLSCGEKNSWTYAGRAVTSVLNLKTTPGMKIPAVLLDILETTLGGGPMVVRLGNASGDSALRSRTTSPNGVIDAGASSMFADMERLILASYVATRSLFTDAVMFGGAGPTDYANVVEGPDGQPREGAGHFVVSSPDIQTFSLTGIVTLAVILLVLILLNGATTLLIHFHHHQPGANNNTAEAPQAEDNKHASSKTGNILSLRKNLKADQHNKWTRFHVLAAAQLFRCVYEPPPGTEARPQWSCDSAKGTHYADASERLVLHACGESARCMGHIGKDYLTGEGVVGKVMGSETDKHEKATAPESLQVKEAGVV
jgi:hypothetical protein